MVILVKEEVTFLTTPGSRFIGHFALEWRGHFHWNMQLISWILEVLTLVNAVPNIKWDNGPESAFNKPNDKVSFIIYNPQKNRYATFKNVAERQDKETVLQLPKRFAGDTVHAWMQYTNAEGNMVSTSVYLGEITVV